MSQVQQDANQQDQLVRLADRTARAVETIRAVAVISALLMGVGMLILIVLATQAANGG